MKKRVLLKNAVRLRKNKIVKNSYSFFQGFLKAYSKITTGSITRSI
jgi:hypothetical protein